MAGKYINILLAGLLTILLLACSDDRDSLSGQASGDPLLTFNMTRAGGDIVGNTLVYLFDGQGSDAGKFNHKVQEVTYGPDRLSMTVAAGMWNIALVTANDTTCSQCCPQGFEDVGNPAIWRNITFYAGITHGQY